VLVDCLPDGALREVSPHSVVSSELASADQTSPTLEHGLGLYVERATDIHLGERGGPVLGRASPGAYLPVVGIRDAVAEVTVPRHGRNEGTELHAFVDASALDVAIPPVPAQGEEGPAETVDLLDLDEGLGLAPRGPVIGRTACGPVHVLERDGKSVRIAQEHDGIRIVAWVEAPSIRRGAHRCARTVERKATMVNGEWVDRDPPIPPGYARVAVGRDPLEPLVRRGGIVSWLVAHGEELACEEWRVRPTKARKEDAAVTWPPLRADFERPTTVDSDPPFGAGGPRLSELAERPRNEPKVPRFQHITLVRHAQYFGARDSAPAQMELEYAEWRGYRPQPGTAEGIALCGYSDSNMVVGTSAGAVTILSKGGTSQTVAYHPEDVESWYLTRTACEADRGALLRGPLSSAHVHRGSGC
jgi:hypothetical protein